MQECVLSDSREDFAIQNAAPFAAQLVEAVADFRREIIFHQPLLHKVRLREGAPFFR